MRGPASPALLLLAGLLPVVASLAQETARPGTVERLRPTGPVTVTADRAEWEKGGAMIYTGNVALTSDTLKLQGQTLELRQFPGGHFEARIRGTPAALEHPGAPAAQPPTAPVSARGERLLYDSRDATVEIAGNARLLRGEDEVNGETIRYDVAARRIRAAGGEGGQVRIVIQPPPPKNRPDAGAAP